MAGWVAVLLALLGNAPAANEGGAGDRLDDLRAHAPHVRVVRLSERERERLRVRAGLLGSRQRAAIDPRTGRLAPPPARARVEQAQSVQAGALREVLLPSGVYKLELEGYLNLLRARIDRRGEITLEHLEGSRRQPGEAVSAATATSGSETASVRSPAESGRRLP